MRRIEKAAVIGSGIMGGGIAALCASAGIKTLLLDIAPFDLTDAEKNDRTAKNRIVEAGLQAQIKARPAAFMDKKHDLALIETGNLTDDFDKLKDADIIFEVVVENLKIKQELFARLEKVMKPGAIIASNTSGLPIAQMAEGRSKAFKENFLILHFFNPVRYMKILECVAGPETSKEVCDFVSKWGEQTLGKGVVWGKDTPNFIGNRIGMISICEALILLDKGLVTIPEADAIFSKPMGIPGTGIFGLTDFVGADTTDHIADNSYELLVNDEFREKYKTPKFFKDMMAKGMFGNKAKGIGGFYLSGRGADGKKFKKVIDIKTLEHVDYDTKATYPVVEATKALKTIPEKIKYIFNNSEFAMRLLSCEFVYCVNRIPEICDTLVEIDNAMKWGYAYEFGPFEMWDAVGLKDSLAGIEKSGYSIPEGIKTMLDKGAETFYRIQDGRKQYWDFNSVSYKDIQYSPQMIFLANIKTDKSKIVIGTPSASLVDIGDDVFCFEYHTKMNAINGEIVNMVPKVVEFIRANGAGMVNANQASGMPGAFSAGGDLKFMLDLAKKGDFQGINNFIADVHDGMKMTKYAPFPVVAAPYGMALGGGCEVCLWADKIVAHNELYMALVEVGAGLVPAGGGCYQMWRRLSESVVTPTDWLSVFLQAFQTIAMPMPTGSAQEARIKGFLRPQDRIVFNKDYLIGEAKKEVLRMAEDGYAPPANLPVKVMGQDAMGALDANIPDMLTGYKIAPHISTVVRRVGYIISGGTAYKGTEISEDAMLALEREMFVDCWKTEGSQKMAEHMATKGKPLFI
ncbi:MAG TPA: 3-hydroxyacyl-CoA dehydrogenase/enoyl-CoA hydratase family protein [Spirochaetota bacterium]|nr:3-hydroxyacyl-CoA dehydrogenase/enoyl-CoA hydratase family protein [Spirochaetota bacterium]HPJ36642.1 3-hydroxyacyl-CoA dehydrogenase/enoyl-CoA hydratase family protein [Spirochaetota bacterium]